MAVAQFSRPLPPEEEIVRLFDWLTFIGKVFGSFCFPDAPIPFQQQAQFQELKVGVERLDTVFADILRTATLDLMDDRKWRPLADRPAEFSQQLDKRLKLLKTVMKSRYGIESNRQSKHWRRDGQIMVLHDMPPRLDFETIAPRFGMTAKAAERAYQRHADRVGRALRYLQECFTYFCQLAESEYAFLLEPIPEVTPVFRSST